MMNPALAAVVYKLTSKSHKVQNMRLLAKAFHCDVIDTFRIFKVNIFRISYALHTTRSLERDKIDKNFI